METITSEIALDFPPYFRAYTDGRVERFFGTDKIPPSPNSSKDITISPETGISARLFIPNTIRPNQKLPLLIYFHGGGFLIGSPFCPTYHNYLTSLVSEANIVAVSVDYRLAPEHHVPIAYEDSWAALKWVASHSNNGQQGNEAWLNDHADFRRVFLAGDSAGGNIAHNMAMRAGIEGLGSMKVLGVCLVQPYFGKNFVSYCGDGDEKVNNVDKYWVFVCPTTTGSDDWRINPVVDSSLWRLGCSRVLVCVAEKDGLRDRGLFYYETLRKSEWGGEVEIVETEGEEHVFHLFNPNCDKAVALLKRVASFFNSLGYIYISL